MVFNPATDFLGLWRNVAGNVSKLEMPGLDYVVAALGRAGVVTVTVSATAPVANQATTAWLKAAVPSYSAEGALFLWDKVTTAYLAATPALFLQLLEASAGENGAAWWTSVGAPLNTLGVNGDFAIRTDEPGGIYGPKAAGAWPVAPIPGTTDIIGSTQLDLTFGVTPGQLIYRGPALWQSLAIGAANSLLFSSGGLVPAWEGLSALMDAVFGAAQGSILYRDAGVWNGLGPGVANQVLATGGPAANPSWANRTAEFPSGTVMLFQQTAAPPGWTKQTALHDYGLRVVSGAVSSTPGSSFSSVFAQTAVGNTTISVTQMPSHSHSTNAAVVGTNQAVNSPGSVLNAVAGATVGSNGGDGAHAHSINLTLSYVDVIIASKN